MGTYEQLLTRQRADVTDGLFTATRHLQHSPARLYADRQTRLRELLTIAAQRPFYAERFQAAGINPARATVASLTRVEPVTKPEMMARFDDIIEPGLTLNMVEQHLGMLNADGYLAGQYRAVATGGSSGVRGVFVYGWDDWVQFMLLQMRWAIRRPAPAGMIGSTFANKGQHVSGALHAFFADAAVPVCHTPATMPITDMVAALNDAHPVTLQGYPTSIGVLAGEQLAGRLHIQPAIIRTCGEQLTDNIRAAAAKAWGVQIVDMWGCAEGVYAYTCTADTGMHLPDDLAIIEPVDDTGQPVPAGQPAAKIYVTNLYNWTQPLIRYELTDAMTIHTDPCPCGCAHSRITNIHGHQDAAFIYHDIVVQPIGLYTVLENVPQIAEFQIVQTPAGIDVKVRTTGQPDVESLRTGLAGVMTAAGLPDPEVTVQTVDAMDRLWSGKLRRFVPLNTAAAPI